MVLNANFKHISGFALKFLMLNLNMFLIAGKEIVTICSIFIKLTMERAESKNSCYFKRISDISTIATISWNSSSAPLWIPLEPVSIFHALVLIQTSSLCQGSLVRTGTVLIFPFFPKTWTQIRALQLNPYPSKLENWHITQVASGEDTCDQNGKPSTPPSPLPTTFYHYFHIPLIP